jgi:hypothetical protein
MNTMFFYLGVTLIVTGLGLIHPGLGLLAVGGLMIVNKAESKD